MSDVIVIGVAGGTGSGKTTLVKALVNRFGDNITVLSHDNYYKRHDELSYEERTKLNYDHPDAFDTDMMIEHLQQLKSGKANGCTCALATSSNRSVADYYLADAHLADYFSVLVCGDEVSRSKPDPQTFLLAMQKLGAQSSAQCAVFEDSRNGLLAGATGGFPVFLVPDLIEPTPEMQALCCATCKTLSDAIALLQ